MRGGIGYHGVVCVGWERSSGSDEEKGLHSDDTSLIRPEVWVIWKFLDNAQIEEE